MCQLTRLYNPSSATLNSSPKKASSADLSIKFTQFPFITQLSPNSYHTEIRHRPPQLYPSATMSEGQEGHEHQEGREVQENRDDQAITTPEADGDDCMDNLSPAWSYDSGFDYLERIASEGEHRYEGKGKGRCMRRPNLQKFYGNTDMRAQLRVLVTCQLRSRRHLVRREAQGKIVRFWTIRRPVRRRVVGLIAIVRVRWDPVRLRPLDQ